MNLNTDIFKIETNHVEPQKGRILIAEPFLPGSYFNRAIVFLVAYSDKGTVGFILNKKIDFHLNDLMGELPEFESEVYLGGPVSTDSVYFIHTLGDTIPGSMHIKGQLYWGGDFDVLKQLILTGQVHSEQIRFFLGYSGWDAGQLEDELKENSWLVSEINDEQILDSSDESLWLKLVREMGGKYSLWENYPENPSMN